MVNVELYKREMKNSLKLFLILAAVITVYVSVIISMYTPEKMGVFDSFVEELPELMAAVGMRAGAVSLLDFMISYLYGFVLLIFPLLFCIIRGNGLIAKYMENGAMAALVAAPVKRRKIAFTQMCVLVSGTLLLILYSTILELLCAENGFPGELDILSLFMLNGGLLCLQLFIGGICFLASCIFSDTKYSLGFGAGLPILMYVLQMLANVGGDAEKIKYLTFFTLFRPEEIAAGESSAFVGIAVLLAGAVVFYGLGVAVFERKDLYL